MLSSSVAVPPGWLRHGACTPRRSTASSSKRVRGLAAAPGRSSTRQDLRLDLGCGWLHSADRNPWVEIAEEQGSEIDTSRPPWARRTLNVGFPSAEQQDFQSAMHAFYARVDGAADHNGDVPAANFLEPGGRWNGLINALGSYIAGAEWDRVSAKDFDRYHDTGVNWRVAKGYGALISACGEASGNGARLHGARHRSSRQAPAHRDRQRRDRRRSGDRHHPECAHRGRTDLCSRRHCRTKPKPRTVCRSGLPTNCLCRCKAPRSSTMTPASSDAPIARRPRSINSVRLGGR